MPSIEIPVQHLFTIRFRTRSTASDGHTAGTRIAVNVLGGEFSGERLSGQVIAGSDWVLRRADSTLCLDVRAELRTDDGVTVFMTYEGLATRDDASTTRIRTTPRFDAPTHSRYAWLNDEVCVGLGELGDGSVAYQIYGLR